MADGLSCAGISQEQPQAPSLSFGSFPDNLEIKPVLDEPGISVRLSSDAFQALKEHDLIVPCSPDGLYQCLLCTAELEDEEMHCVPSASLQSEAARAHFA